VLPLLRVGVLVRGAPVGVFDRGPAVADFGRGPPVPGLPRLGAISREGETSFEPMD